MAQFRRSSRSQPFSRNAWIQFQRSSIHPGSTSGRELRTTSSSRSESTRSSTPRRTGSSTSRTWKKWACSMQINHRNSRLPKRRKITRRRSRRSTRIFQSALTRRTTRTSKSGWNIRSKTGGRSGRASRTRRMSWFRKASKTWAWRISSWTSSSKTWIM